MASLTKDKAGKWRLIFYRDKLRRETTFKANKLNAERIKLIVERRLDQLTTGEADRELARMLKNLPDDLRSILERIGLYETASRRNTLQDLVDAFCHANDNVKPRTILNRQAVINNLITFFGQPRQVESITQKEADEFYHWMRNESRQVGDGTALKPATYLRRIKTVKSIFALAVRYKWIDENPFAHIKGGNATDESRFYFISTENARKIYDACPNAFWRLVWAFARWGGLRMRSEFPLLRWDGILWDMNKITVYEPKKTRKGEALKTRFIPIFPEIRDALNEAWELTQPGDVYLSDFYARMRFGKKPEQNGKWNPTTTLEKIIIRAGIQPWGKLLQNCRATRETELAETFPIHAVTAWIGNTTNIAQKHYLQIRDEYFHNAAGGESMLHDSSDTEPNNTTPNDSQLNNQSTFTTTSPKNSPNITQEITQRPTSTDLD